MATIRASCETCGDVELSSDDVTVRVCREDSAGGTYTFTCPNCGDLVVKGAESHVIELLVTSGVRLVTWSIPEELREPRSGKPIDHDDILDFHALMQREDWMDMLHRPSSH